MRVLLLGALVIAVAASAALAASGGAAATSARGASAQSRVFSTSAYCGGRAEATRDTCAGQPSGGGAFAARNGKIAFTSDRSGGTDVWVMNPDGSAQTNLTNHAGNDVLPAWSPDGTKIAFTTYRTGNYEVFVMNADGSDQTNLTRNPGSDHNAAWSPDGRKIAFTRYLNRNFDVWVMNADGSGQERLTHTAGFDWEPAWSPDGTKIAFSSFRDRNEEIYVMRADGSAQTRLTYNALPGNAGWDFKPTWSPNGKKIAFTSDRDTNNEIYVMNADGSRQRNLTRYPGAYDRRPAWSPDGTKILFSSSRNHTGYNDEIYVMNSDGSGQTQLTHDPGEDREPDWQALGTARSAVHRLQSVELDRTRSWIVATSPSTVNTIPGSKFPRAWEGDVKYTYTFKAAGEQRQATVGAHVVLRQTGKRVPPIYVSRSGTITWTASGSDPSCSWKAAGSRSVNRYDATLGFDGDGLSYKAVFSSPDDLVVKATFVCLGKASVAEQSVLHPFFFLFRITAGVPVDRKLTTISGSRPGAQSTSASTEKWTNTWRFTARAT